MELQVFFERALFVSYFSIGIVTLIGLLRFKRLNNDQSTLLFLVFVTIIVELAGRVFWKFDINNLFLYHFYSPIEFLLLASLYRRHLGGLIKPAMMNGLIMGFILFAVINTLFFQNLTQFNSNVTFTECLLLIVLAFMYFYVLLRDLQYRALERNPMFWINVSVLTYFSGALVLFHVANDLIPESLKVRGVVWGVHAIFNVVHYLLYAVALLVKPEKESSSFSAIS